MMDRMSEPKAMEGSCQDLWGDLDLECSGRKRWSRRRNLRWEGWWRRQNRRSGSRSVERRVGGLAERGEFVI